LKKKGYDSEKKDILNKRLFSLNVCGWNLLHILFYFLFCVFLNVKTTREYFLVFLTGVFWFFLEQLVFLQYNKYIDENVSNDAKYVYASISYPRYDDIIFNLFGILLYYVMKK
jgi:hypothetical protein